MKININIRKSTKKQQKYHIIYKEKINITTSGKEMKKNASTTTKEISSQDEEKNARTKAVKPKAFNLPSQILPWYQTNILSNGLKFTTTTRHNNIALTSNIQNYTDRMQFAEFFQ